MFVFLSSGNTRRLHILTTSLGTKFKISTTLKEQLNTLFQTAMEAGEKIRGKAAAAGQATMDNVIQRIEKWLEEFPKIESYGLRQTSFAFSMSISPSLEVELQGKNSDFPAERLAEILAESKSTSLSFMIFSAVKTTHRLHRKIAQVPDELLIIRIRLSISPEISVNVGRPRVF